MRIIEPELSYKILGILFSVHTSLGGRYQEKYYQKAIELELKQAQLNYKKEIPVPLEYKGRKIGNYRLDFLIEEKIVLEIKTVLTIERKELLQVLAYLKATQKPLAIIANFRGTKLTYRRIINPKVAPK